MSKIQAIISGGVAIAIGVILLSEALKDSTIASIAKEKPQRITCKQLIAEGPKDNAHLILKDFVYCDNMFVTLTEVDDNGRETDDFYWKAIWVPLVPADDPWVQGFLAAREAGGDAYDKYPPPSQIKIILKSKTVPKDDYFANLDKKTIIKGIVINEIEQISGEELKLLQDTYKFDPQKVWLIEEGRALKSTSSLMGKYAIAGVLMLGGLIFISFKFLKGK